MKSWKSSALVVFQVCSNDSYMKDVPNFVKSDETVLII